MEILELKNKLSELNSKDDVVNFYSEYYRVNTLYYPEFEDKKIEFTKNLLVHLNKNLFSLKLFNNINKSNFFQSIEKKFYLNQNNDDFFLYKKKLFENINALDDNDKLEIFDTFIKNSMFDYIYSLEEKDVTLSLMYRYIENLKFNSQKYSTNLEYFLNRHKENVKEDNINYVKKYLSEVVRMHISVLPISHCLKSEQGTSLFLKNLNRNYFYSGAINYLNLDSIKIDDINTLLKIECLNYKKNNIKNVISYDAVISDKLKKIIKDFNYKDFLTDEMKKDYFFAIYDSLTYEEILNVIYKIYKKSPGEFKELENILISSNENDWLEVVSKFPETLLIVPEDIKNLDFLKRLIDKTNSFIFFRTEDLENPQIVNYLFENKVIDKTNLIYNLSEKFIINDSELKKIMLCLAEPSNYRLITPENLEVINSVLYQNETYKTLLHNKYKNENLSISNFDTLIDSFISIVNKNEMISDLPGISKKVKLKKF